MPLFRALRLAAFGLVFAGSAMAQPAPPPGYDDGEQIPPPPAYAPGAVYPAPAYPPPAYGPPAFHCRAHFHTPYGPRHAFCALPGPQPVGSPCFCAPPPVPPGYPPPPPMHGHAVP